MRAINTVFLQWTCMLFRLVHSNDSISFNRFGESIIGEHKVLFYFGYIS